MEFLTMKRLIVCAVHFACVQGLAACGIKGDLYMPNLAHHSTQAQAK
jgi:predicted small lipoprotein YifL